MLSKKINSINPSLTLELSAKINKLKNEGVKVYNFTVGEPDFKTPRYIIDKTINFLTETIKLFYTWHNAGISAFIAWVI